MPTKAELTIMTSGRMSMTGAKHLVAFDSLDEAQAEYTRLQAMIPKSDVSSNGTPTIVEVVGSQMKLSFLASELKSVTLADWAKLERSFKENKKNYPALYAGSTRRK
jgi:hypothetical protein